MSTWNQLLVQYPRFADTLVRSEDARLLTVEELCSAEVISTVVAKGREIFGIDQDKHAAQLWFHTLCNGLVGPSVAAMVEFEAIPNLDIAQGELHSVDGFWFGFRPCDFDVPGSSFEEAGRQFGRSIAPVIDALCEVSGLRPAPLWAVASDSLGLNASGAGVEAFEEEHARVVATELIAGVNQVREVPTPRFDEGDYFRRAGCCMIFHSPCADFCTSCPQKR